MPEILVEPRASAEREMRAAGTASESSQPPFHLRLGYPDHIVECTEEVTADQGALTNLESVELAQCP